jgi:hypothetical protein
MATNYNPRTVTDGLVLHVDAANPKSYPGSGSTWYDMSTSSINGTLDTHTFDSTTKSLTFSGNNTSCDIQLAGVPLNTTTGNTIEQWFNCAANNSMPITFWDLQLDLWVSNSTFGINNGASLIYGIDFTNLFNTWVHCAVYIPYNWSSVTASNAKMYINGESQTLTQRQGGFGTRTVTSSQNMGIGGGFISGSNTYNFSGKIATTKIYSRELTAAEIAQNFEATRGRFGI